MSKCVCPRPTSAQYDLKSVLIQYSESKHIGQYVYCLTVCDRTHVEVKQKCSCSMATPIRCSSLMKHYTVSSSSQVKINIHNELELVDYCKYGSSILNTFFSSSPIFQHNPARDVNAMVESYLPVLGTCWYLIHSWFCLLSFSFLLSQLPPCLHGCVSSPGYAKRCADAYCLVKQVEVSR